VLLFLCARSPTLSQPQTEKLDDSGKHELKYDNRNLEIAAGLVFV
jgi:hypothetical protein